MHIYIKYSTHHNMCVIIICSIIEALVNDNIQDKEFIQELITGDEDPDRSVKGIVSTLERNGSKVYY